MMAMLIALVISSRTYPHTGIATARAFTFDFIPSIRKKPQERGTSLLLPVAGPRKAPNAVTREDNDDYYNGDYYNDDNNNDEDEFDCLPPGRRPEPKYIFVISDSTGVTAKSAISKCLVQFGSSCDERFQSTKVVPDTEDNCLAVGSDGTLTSNTSSSRSNNISLDDYEVDDCNVQTKTYTFIRTEKAIASIVKKAQELQAFVVFTIADPVLREKTVRMCVLSNTPVIDLLGPSLNALSSFLGRRPAGLAGSHDVYDKYDRASDGSTNNKRRRIMPQLSDIYFRRIEAIEFTLRADDGQAPWLLPQADVILVGVSRTGKTPLSVLLSQQMGLKVANIPLVLEVAPPKELLDQNLLDSKRIFCLTIAPGELKRIRTTRLERSQVLQLEEERNFESGTAAGFAKGKSNIGSRKPMPRNSYVHERESVSDYNDRRYLLKDLRNAKDLSKKI
mmetsp:Transcript_16457/g.24640  ORF Transcript_16457/g.24640 Transcript_16457/m.24640 type:complete len:448 (+) Transcript_16457:83-1426(+)